LKWEPRRQDRSKLARSLDSYWEPKMPGRKRRVHSKQVHWKMLDRLRWVKRRQGHSKLAQSWGSCLVQKMLGLRTLARSTKGRKKQGHLKEPSWDGCWGQTRQVRWRQERRRQVGLKLEPKKQEQTMETSLDSY
jgi:hypothetical protein